MDPWNAGAVEAEFQARRRLCIVQVPLVPSFAKTSGLAWAGRKDVVAAPPDLPSFVTSLASPTLPAPSPPSPSGHHYWHTARSVPLWPGPKNHLPSPGFLRTGGVSHHPPVAGRRSQLAIPPVPTAPAASTRRARVLHVQPAPTSSNRLVATRPVRNAPPTTALSPLPARARAPFQVQFSVGRQIAHRGRQRNPPLRSPRKLATAWPCALSDSTRLPAFLSALLLLRLPPLRECAPAPADNPSALAVIPIGKAAGREADRS
ncbi:uncharacterized protein EI97DRAFT_454745 [Westerdykella ornata]|uniref:Uncharacterized protein n=1 Tax=Westerdykella ornata TaxID=318751 RepID=A0A6A6JZD8_WESOR|nr:uncharacterized protein EI97DRAFT_454745 [Westerdykella ornata]KAF2281575.1 hypothetical protein EI97DRAFT_454745 [Westerdykella ornata]